MNQLAVDMMNNMFMTQMVNEPTRQKNILDLVFTSCPDLVKNTSVIPGISDHSAVSVEITARAMVNKKKPRKVLLYAKMNKEAIEKDLKTFTTRFNATKGILDAEQNWCRFKQGLHQIITDHVPSKVIRCKNNLPWINHGIRRALKKKNKIYKKAKKSGKQTHWEKYKDLQAQCKEKMKTAYGDYLKGLFEGDNGKPSKNFWKAIKARRKDNVGVPPLRNEEGKLATEPAEKASILSEQYKQVFTDESTNNIPDLGQSPFRAMKQIRITNKGVEKLLSRLNPKKAIGPDMVSTRILKDFAHKIAPIIASIFQQSLNTGQVPNDWKQANVVAIYKKSKKDDPANYRPVSLTSVTCKCLEHIIFSEIMKHIDSNNILVPFQHGFRSGRSTETQLIQTIDDPATTLNLKGRTNILILDFSKAFDTVAHQRLLRKLHYYGIRGGTEKWLSQWLTDRTQTVVVDGENSPPERVKSPWSPNVSPLH